MSDAETEQAPAAPNGKKKRSPIELVVVWGLIALLGVAVALEYCGMTGYKQTLDAMEAQLDESRTDPDKLFLLSEAKKMGTMGAKFSAPVEREGTQESKVSWFTLLSFLPGREYAIYLGLDGKSEDPGILSITTAADRAEEERIRKGSQ